MTDSGSYTSDDLNDPAIDAETLRQLAAERADLWPQILQHPNCYPGLAEYIRGQQAPPQPPAGQPQQQGPGAGEQITAGARQVADGAKDYWTNSAAPAVAGATRSAQRTVQANRGSWQFWVQLSQPVIAFLGFITLFTPAIRVLDEYNIEGYAEGLAEELGLSDELSAARDELGLHTTQNFITHDMTAAGVILLLLFVAAIGLAVASLVTSTAILRLAAAATGALSGLIGIIVSIIYLVAAGDDHLTVGFGAVLMLILGILLIGASVIALLAQKKPAPPQPQQ
ncbi:hypothetical protein [Nesterenkonia jeotgali]|uniref:Uncharacterized membrane protein HdeD (DUF308 family) n=1 Tax=Nesterenkonia jeotgali TaxID=317018 RepID=A0A839FSP3_9MICC|nr:hypothetical protein [Nesterenkonia jeotgali]MBA8921342.1 uncharacterized membrane protein HdeD (DUF308 family) [Nesterenkonia jeotgali]